MNQPLAAAPIRFVMQVLTATSVAAQLAGLPFKGDDFGEDERVYWARPLHSESGVQKFGYDLDVRRYIASEKRWRATTGTGNTEHPPRRVEPE